MQLINKLSKVIRVSYIFGKYTWVASLKHQKDVTISNDFQKMLDESDRKPNKIWANKGNKFTNRSMKSWL